MLKENLWKENHPVTKSIREIPQIVRKEEDRYETVIHSCISLKQLFARENMDRYHVDCLVLYRIASGVLHIMEELSLRHICPGLYDLADFYVDLHSSYFVYLLHPERFQLLDLEQDYEWYPEDERLFGDIVLFDEAAQRLSDVRLLYKILVASTKGNVRVPPKDTAADYSALFYKTLSPKWRSLFLKEEGVSHNDLEALLTDSIKLEKESDRLIRDRHKAQAEAALRSREDQAESSTEEEKPDTGCGTIYSMFVLLRTEIRHSGRISRMLYQQQDELEMETGLAGQNSCQGFVYGNGTVCSQSYAIYPEGFRIQCEQQIKDYSAGEAMIIASELVKEHRSQVLEPGSEWRIYLITDGRLKNDQVFQAALARLGELKKQGCILHFISDPGYHCEACERLKQLAEA